MSNYTPLYTSIWSDAKFTEYTSEQQLIFIYLISNPSCKLSGIYQIPPKQIAYSTNIPINKVIDSLKEFNSDTLEYNTAAGVVFIKNHFKHNLNKIGNPKTMLQSLLKCSNLTKHDDFWDLFIKKYNKEVDNLASRVKDLNISNIADSFLSNYLIKNEPSKHKDSSHTESSVDPHLISVSVSVSNKDIKEVKNKKVEIPDFIEKDLWKDFVEMRVKLKAVNSARALEGIIKKLEGFNERGINPNECLEKSIESSWKTVYEPKQSLYPSKGISNHKTHEPSDKVLRAIERTRALGELAKRHGCNSSDLTQNQIREL